MTHSEKRTHWMKEAGIGLGGTCLLIKSLNSNKLSYSADWQCQWHTINDPSLIPGQWSTCIYTRI